MKSRKITGFILLAVLLSSCELLGIGGSDSKKDKKEQLPPELIWENNFFSELNGPAPIIEDSSLFAAGSFGLSRLSAVDGDGIWASSFDTPVKVVKMQDDEENLYLRCEQSLRAYSKADGTLLWNIALEDTIKADRLAAGTSLTVQSKTHLFVGTQERVLIINKQGVIEYEVIPEVPAGYVTRFNVPVVSKSGDKLYVLSSYVTNSGVYGRITAYSLASESLLWRKDLPFPLPHIGDFLAPTLQLKEAGNNLVVMTGPAVIAFDMQTGKEVWRHLFYEGRTAIDIGNLIIYSNGSIYAGADFRILKLDVATGRKEWEIETFGMIERLFVEGNNLYFSSSSGINPVIYSVNAETGEKNFQLSPPDSGLLAGFTAAFDASKHYLIDIGVQKIYAYRLPDYYPTVPN